MIGTEQEAAGWWCPKAMVVFEGTGLIHTAFPHNRILWSGGQGEQTNTQESPPMARCLGSRCAWWEWEQTTAETPSSSGKFATETVLPREQWIGRCGAIKR